MKKFLFLSIVFLFPLISFADVTCNYATWNPSDKGASFSLSGGNLVATHSGAFESIRATQGVSEGKFYWEYTISGSNDWSSGVGDINALINGVFQDSAQGYGYYSANGYKYNVTGSAYGATYSTNDVIGIALDMDSGVISWYKNGASQGANAFTGLTGTFYPMLASNNNSAVTANFGQSSMVYSVPSGYLSGFSNDCTVTEEVLPVSVSIIGLSNISYDTLMMYIWSPLIALFIFFMLKLFGLFKW